MNPQLKALAPVVALILCLTVALIAAVNWNIRYDLHYQHAGMLVGIAAFTGLMWSKRTEP
jgi:hypothetical protein